MGKSSVFWPVAWILIGVVILVYNLGLLPAETIKYWPILLVLGGLVALTSGEEKK